MNPLIFTDPAFLFFFAPIVLTGYWIIPAAWRNGVLLAASLFLYAWGEARYVAVLGASILINWLGGLAIVHFRQRRLALLVGIGANLALLGLFKYAAHYTGFRLPAGISFYTFMGISYLVDLYRRDLPAAASLGRVGLLLAMFPHLIAGPIVRMTELREQFEARFWNPQMFASGARRFVIGLGKKVLIANTLSSVPDAVFGAQAVPAAYAWLGLVSYTLQIYFDFSGYSDMAIGLAAMLGFRFPENFHYPYVSRSITEFWRRWHMTLSNWLRDYLFFPLGVRGGPLLLVRNLMIVFFVCGLWHGASWNFIAWGLWHGMLLSLEQLGLKSALRRAPLALQSFYTLGAVAMGWVLFRSATIPAAWGFVKSLAGLGGKPLLDAQFLGPATYVALAAGVIAAVPWPVKLPHLLEFALLSLVFVAAVAGIAGDTYKPFIYFRF